MRRGHQIDREPGLMLAVPGPRRDPVGGAASLALDIGIVDGHLVPVRPVGAHDREAQPGGVARLEQILEVVGHRPGHLVAAHHREAGNEVERVDGVALVDHHPDAAGISGRVGVQVQGDAVVVGGRRGRLGAGGSGRRCTTGRAGSVLGRGRGLPQRANRGAHAEHQQDHDPERDRPPPPHRRRPGLPHGHASRAACR